MADASSTQHPLRSMHCLPSAPRQGSSMAVMLDGGIRYGSDIAKALVRGADFCFVARPTLYGVAAAGQAGAEHALRLLIEGLSRTMALMGVTDVNGIGHAEAIV